MRVGFISTFSIMMSEPGTISAATSGKPAEDGSPGTAMRLAGELALALDADVPHAVAVGLDLECGAEALQHLFGVVARHDRLDRPW